MLWTEITRPAKIRLIVSWRWTFVKEKNTVPSIMREAKPTIQQAPMEPAPLKGSLLGGSKVTAFSGSSAHANLQGRLGLSVQPIEKRRIYFLIKLTRAESFATIIVADWAC